MEKRVYEKRSREQWDELWKRALTSSRCPLAGCDLRTSTCKHLDRYLAAGASNEAFRPRIDLVFIGELDEFEVPPVRSVGVWELYKKLSKLELSSLQIRILLRADALGMPRKLIMRELKMKSVRVFQEQLYSARDLIKKRGSLK